MSAGEPASPAADGERAVVERVTARHKAAVVAFFRREWGGADSPGHPHFDPGVPQWVCLRGDHAIGYLGSIPARFRLRGSTVDGHWLKGFWVQPEYRSGPVGFMLLKKAVSELGVIGVSTVALPARRLFEALGVPDRCPLFNRLLLLRTQRVLGTLDPARSGISAAPAWTYPVVRGLQKTRLMLGIAAVAAVALRAYRLPSDVSARGFTIRCGWDVADHQLDGLWARLQDQVQATPVRDAPAITSRYRDDGAYDLVTVWSGSTLEGWSIVRQPNEVPDPRLSGLRVASLSDALYPLIRPAVGAAVVRGAESSARVHRADALLCSASHPAFERVLSRRGYAPLPANVHFMARDSAEYTFGTLPDEIWVTRGDAYSDETF
jgi:GNAT superfamily N-acetyltransferase